MRRLAFIIVVYLVLALVPKVISPSLLSSGSFQLYLSQNGSVGVAESEQYWSMELTSALPLNGSGSILQYQGSGEFRFESNTIGTIEISTNIDSLKVKINDVVTPLTSGSTFSFINADDVVILWSVPLAPLFPILFALGMFGLASMFGGSIYGAYLIKKREFNEDLLIMTLVTITVGIALFIAWVTA